MTKPIRITMSILLMSICGGCCETCDHTHHGRDLASSNNSIQFDPSDRIDSGLLAIKSSIREQEAAISRGDVPEFLKAMKWMIRVMTMTRSDLDSLPEAERPAVVQKVMQNSDSIPSLYRSDRFRSFQQSAPPEVRREMDEFIQQVQDMDLENWSSKILESH